MSNIFVWALLFILIFIVGSNQILFADQRDRMEGLKKELDNCKNQNLYQ